MRCEKCGGKLAWYKPFIRKCVQCGTPYKIESARPRPFTMTEKDIRRLRRAMEALAKRQWPRKP